MKPINNEHCNFTFNPPQEWAEGTCEPLRVRVGSDVGGQPVIQSFWQPSEEDIASILAGQPIILSIFGTGMPPVWLEVAK